MPFQPARTRDHQTEPVLVGRPPLFCPCRARKSRVNEQIKFPAATKELKGHEREMDIFCCLTLNAVFQSNYLSLLQPLLAHWHCSQPEFRLGALTRMWWIRCIVSIPFLSPTPPFAEMCGVLSTIKKICNRLPYVSNLRPFP